MYSYEIDNVIRQSNYILDWHTYCNICDSPQVNHVKYDENENVFHIWTNDNCYWKIKLKKG